MGPGSLWPLFGMWCMMPQGLRNRNPWVRDRACYFGCKVSAGAFQWYRSSYGTDFDNSEIVSPV